MAISVIRKFEFLVSPYGLIGSALQAADPSELKIKVYKVQVSTSVLCTDLITLVKEKTTPEEVNFLNSPTIGSGELPEGTYKCVVITMSDNIKFKTSAATGSCAANTEYTLDLCRSDSGGTSTDPSDAVTTCTGSSTTGVKGDDKVYLYLTSNSSAPTTSAAAAFQRPTSTSSTNGLKLQSDLVISANATSKFVVDGTGKVDGSNSSCDMNAPVFSFKKVE